jgi:hypothetical protein
MIDIRTKDVTVRIETNILVALILWGMMAVFVSVRLAPTDQYRPTQRELQ